MYICIHIFIYTYTHIYIYIYLYICLALSPFLMLELPWDFSGSEVLELIEVTGLDL